MMKRVILLLLLFGAVAHAQGISLPKMDSISFYGELGDFESRQAKNNQPVVYGWGFETAFTVASGPAHIVELAVGYDQFYEHFTLNNGGMLSGELRSLPSISVYLTFANDLYIGLGTGVISLNDATVTMKTGTYQVGGSTFDMSARVGYAFPFQPGKPLANRRAYGFVEADYHVRYFDGLDYTPTSAPATLPERIYLGGATVSAGVQVMLDASSAKVKAK